MPAFFCLKNFSAGIFGYHVRRLKLSVEPSSKIHVRHVLPCHSASQGSQAMAAIKKRAMDDAL
jgi:hypothetical protein